MNTSVSTALLAVVLATLLAPGSAAASDPSPKPAAAPKTASDARELAAARADLARAAARVAELARPQAEDAVRITRRLERRPVVGVLLAPDERAGVRIAGVTPDSAAAKAGLRSGDRLVSVHGSPILGSDGELRIANARKLLSRNEAGKPVRLGYVRDGRNATVAVTPKISEHVFVFDSTDVMRGVDMQALQAGTLRDLDIETLRLESLRDLDTNGIATKALRDPGFAEEIRREVARIGADCKGKDCRAPRLLSAFRWNGLNLASIDPQLGRYFGTDRGVLVLSTGELDGLQAGDVIQRVDGKAVATPREVMDALRGKPADAKVGVGYLRERKPGSAQVTVPKLMPSLIPPAPPAPPAPPRPASAPKPPKPPAAPSAWQAPPAPMVAAAMPPPPPAPPAPPPPAVTHE